MTIYSQDVKRVLGSQLSKANQRNVLSTFSNRFTNEHKPVWAQTPMPNGNNYPVHFSTDREWLENTQFAVNTAGDLNELITQCISSPTWPNNPEKRCSASL